MSYMKSRSKLAAVLAVIILSAGGVGFWVLRDSPQSTTAPNSSNNKNQPSSQALQPAISDTANFTYQKPADWANLSQEQLTASVATSGIVRSASPVATFMVKVSSSVPKNNADLKSSTLAELQKLTSFSLVSNTATKVDGKSGQKFTYTFNNNDKTRQEMSVLIYKQKTFFLLFTATDADFSKASVDFAKILADFKFK